MNIDGQTDGIWMTIPFGPIGAEGKNYLKPQYMIIPRAPREKFHMLHVKAHDHYRFYFLCLSSVKHTIISLNN